MTSGPGTTRCTSARPPVQRADALRLQRRLHLGRTPSRSAATCSASTFRPSPTGRSYGTPGTQDHQHRGQRHRRPAVGRPPVARSSSTAPATKFRIHDFRNGFCVGQSVLRAAHRVKARLDDVDLRGEKDFRSPRPLRVGLIAGGVQRLQCGSATRTSRTSMPGGQPEPRQADLDRRRLAAPLSSSGFASDSDETARSRRYCCSPHAVRGDRRPRLPLRRPAAAGTPAAPTLSASALLDDVQKRTFLFFWETTNPRNGLVPTAGRRSRSPASPRSASA